MNQEALVEAAKAIYGRFARISDPGTREYRWDRMMPSQREAWISEAQAAIETYLYLTGEK